jgi:hypothetical protein
MAHMDGENTIKQISFVSYSNYEIVGIGESMRTALANYKTKLRERNILSNNKSKGMHDITGVITHVKNTTDNTYFMIDNFNRIFVATNNLSEEVFVTDVGDKIRIKFENSTGKEIYVDFFDNLDVIVDTTSTSLEKYYQHFEDSLKTDRYAKDFDANYKNLSADEKYKVKGVKTNTSQNPDDVKISKKAKAKVENENKKK